MKTILLTGKTGQVGWELQQSLAHVGNVIAPSRATMNLANADSIVATIRDIKPDVIVNAAAYTDVDKAETEADVAMAINGLAPGIMAEEARRIGAMFIHFSTDFVFDGAKTTPYEENDPPNPLNVYGHTKLAGESAIQECGGNAVIFRTAWVYGLRGRNFLRTILQKAAEHQDIRVVEDQFGAPTWSRMIAQTTAQILAKPSDANGIAPGIYHLTAAGSTSRFQFAQCILDEAQRRERYTHLDPAKIIPITSPQWLSAVRRPRNSVLSVRKLETALGLTLPHWKTLLSQCLTSQDALF